MADTETITLTRVQFEAMVKAVAVLRALTNAGVEEWEGYTTAVGPLFFPAANED